MKNFKTLLLTVALVIGGAINANAQAKTAHVDVNEIMTKMPAIIEAKKQLEKITQTYEGEFATMRNEYQAKVTKYSAEAESTTEAVNQERMKEVSDMEKRIQDFGQNAQQELQKKEQDLFKPIQEKIKASIAKVGKAKGFQYVLDASMVLLADGPDITVDVKKDLGF